MGRPGGPGPLDPIFDVDTIYGQFAYDNTPGTPRLPCTINQAAGQDDPTVDLPILFTAVFDRAVTGFETGDVTITGTAGASTGVVTEVAPFDGTTYQVAVSDVVQEGTVTATILASVCTAVDDGMPNGHSTSTDNTVTYALTFVEEFCDPFTTPGSLVWDAQYTFSTWALSDLGGGGFTVAGGVASTTSASPTKEIKHAATSNRNAWASAVNETDYTIGSDRTLRLLINVGLDGAGASPRNSTYYYALVGRVSGTPTVGLGKWFNNIDWLIATTALTVPVGSAIRVRHDGIGGLFLDVNNVEVLAGQDTVESTTGCWLRALGVGLGGASGSDSVAISDFCTGIWGEGSTPVPIEPSVWNIADAQDTDTITSILWTQSMAPWPAWSSTTLINGLGGCFTQSSGTLTNGYLALTDASQLASDQFCEATLKADATTSDAWVLLRSPAAGQGYGFRYTVASGGRWEIFKQGVGLLASAAATQPGDYRIRAEAQGTALRLYHWTGGAWSLVVSTTDATFAGPDNVRLLFNDVSGQGVPYIHDVVVGNL